MNVTLYSMTEDPRVVHKSPTALTTIACTIKGDIDILRPVIELTYSAAKLNANYMYLDEFERYYFITATATTGNRLTLSGEIDPLKTYSNDIDKLSTTILRQEYVNWTDVRDDRVQVDSEITTKAIALTDGVNQLPNETRGNLLTNQSYSFVFLKSNGLQKSE